MVRPDAQDEQTRDEGSPGGVRRDGGDDGQDRVDTDSDRVGAGSDRVVDAQEQIARRIEDIPAVDGAARGTRQ